MSAITAIAVAPVKNRRANAGAVQMAQANQRRQDDAARGPEAISSGRGGNAMPVASVRYTKAFAPLDGARLLTLVERDDGQCCWPHDGPHGTLFCGLDTARTGDRNAQNYCRAHQAMRFREAVRAV